MTDQPSFPAKPETVAIVDYGAGNLRSAQKAFEHAAREAGLSRTITVTREADAIAAADRIVLPGVGAFGACAAGLRALPGAIEALNEAVMRRKKPFLGICVGMQLLADHGAEFGQTPGLGWISGSVRPFEADRGLRIPHMGWNMVSAAGGADSPHPVMAPIGSGTDLYFVHSFYFDVENNENCVALCTYGAPFAAAVAKDNIIGVQFHPEKSQRAGLDIIGAFLTWTP